MALISVGKKLFAVVDDCDVAIANQHKWREKTTSYGTVYPITEYRGTSLLLSRLIMDAPNGSIVDHINHQPLDNRRENLRFVTRRQNTENRNPRFAEKKTSKYFGVSYDKSRKKWRATIKDKLVWRQVGRFRFEEEAKVAYDNARRSVE
mgnify:CR=1 FL=1